MKPHQRGLAQITAPRRPYWKRVRSATNFEKQASKSREAIWIQQRALTRTQKSERVVVPWKAAQHDYSMGHKGGGRTNRAGELAEALYLEGHCVPFQDV